MRNTIKCEGKIEGAWESVLSLCGSCLCLFFNFRFCVSAIHFRSLVSSHSAVFFGTTQQVSVFGCLIQYYTLAYLKYFMTVQNKKPLCALLILSSETIYNLNYNSKKNECALSDFKEIMRICLILVFTSKIKKFYEQLKEKYYIKNYHHGVFNFSGSSLFLLLASRSRQNNLCVFPLSLLNEKALAT